MITVEQAESLVTSKLSPKRAHHVFCVRDMAVKLANLYKADAKKAELSALLHDIVKEQTSEENLQLLETGAIILKMPINEVADNVLHAPAGAVFAFLNLGVKDSEILNAIAYHTTGKTNMSLLDKIIYVADKISLERDYPGVEELREMATQGHLNDTVITIMQQSIKRLQEQGRPVDETTQEALQYLLNQQTEA